MQFPRDSNQTQLAVLHVQQIFRTPSSDSFLLLLLFTLGNRTLIEQF